MGAVPREARSRPAEWKPQGDGYSARLRCTDIYITSRQEHHSHVTGLPQHRARRCVRREGRRREGAHWHGRHPRKRRRHAGSARPHQHRHAQDRPVNTSPHTNWDASARQSRHDRGGSLEITGTTWRERGSRAFLVAESMHGVQAKIAFWVCLLQPAEEELGCRGEDAC